MELKITSQNFLEKVLKEKEKPVLLDCFTEWCMPCKMLSPIISEIAKENKELIVGKIDLEKNQDIAEKFHITGIPVLFLFKNGEVLDTKVGSASKEEILKFLEKNGIKLDK